jgi:hypothetical protein
VSKLTGGKELALLNRQNSSLGSLLAKLIDAHNHVAAQAGVDPVGQASAPPPPQGVDATVIGEQLHIRATDNNPTDRARTYFSEIHADPNYTSPKMVIQHGSTRDAQVQLPTLNSAGVMQPYYLRIYSQAPGSPPSPPINYPVPITMANDGTTQGDLPPSAGSGTSPASGTVSAQGFGQFPTRKATGVKRNV